ncbi:efflux RND transporter permease subunit [Roseiconus lacunae]|uniref:MMPL family transporter n=1 Tax=Roseiconus lacunae TaxID=2605694 RepID=A0ABT7PD85_9BACT|nr:MMPL family transporter [Roseiconus lacunae]MDM4014469.1 MMPL family transporter [Roseiconus lacunae]
MQTSQRKRGQAEPPLLERRSILGLSWSLVILFLFFFMMPFAFRSARLSLKSKENDVKDWLPSDFVETSELSWFAKHFIGESFVIATWPGCTEDDQRLRLLASKLERESSQSDPAEHIKDPKLAEDYRRAKELGVRLGLLPASRELNNWGGKNEKWLVTADGKHYYITPDGRLFRWDEASNGPAALGREIKRTLNQFELSGTFIAAFGAETKDDHANPFHNDPTLVCAPMFRTVQTGVSLVKELSKEGGLLWPVDLTDPSRRPIVARRRAMERLTGSLFAPAVPEGFTWTAEEFRRVIADDQQDAIPENFATVVETTLKDFADQRFGGDLDQLAKAETNVQTDAWYAVFDAAELPPPPRQTCLLITLTDAAQDNLAYALGRGVLGGPRGRLLQLAEDSGVKAASPPSVAPPPFNQPEVESVAGLPPLRLGGPPVDNIAIDEEGTITLVRLVGYSIFVGVLLSYLCFTSFKITLMVFIVGGAAAMLSMAFVGWTGGRVDAVLMSMPSLVYVLGLSGAIHVVNYYRDEVRSGGRRGAAGRAIRHAAFPCTLAALTTAIGLGSLYTSNLAPISNFGFYAAIGVIATLAILFTYLPAALQTFVTESKSPRSQPKQTESGESWLSDQWAAVGAWICRRHWWVTAACLLVLGGASLGLSKIKTSVQLLKLFDEDARIIRDYAWLEKNFGKLVPMELVLRVPPSHQSQLASVDGKATEVAEAPGEATSVPLDILERVEAVARINHVVHQTLGEPGMGIVGSATAVNTFLKPLPDVTNSWSPVRSQFVKELTAGRDELLANDYVRLEQYGPMEGSELWRISLRVSALSDVDYGQFIETLRTSVEPVLRAYDTRDAILAAIESGQVSNKKKPIVVMMGAAKPAPLNQTTMIEQEPNDETGESRTKILTHQIYLSVLEELLRGERIPEPKWFDPNSSEKPIEIGGELWDKVVGISDVMVWVGESDAPTAELSNADALVDGSEIFHKTITHGLVDDRIPASEGAGAMEVIYTGVVPVVYKAQRTLLGSLVESIAMAFVLIAIVMVVLLNPASDPVRFLRPRNAFSGFMSGAISMIPNMFPVLLIFGCMGHLGSLVDIGTMMTASVAMGVAVDDTIHFLSWFRAFLDKGYDRLKAVEMTYRRVGPAMTQTTIVGGLGLFVFALSTFTPTQRFGTLMLILLFAALIGDLILLPALLAGPLGKFFKPRVGASDNTPQPGEEPFGQLPADIDSPSSPGDAPDGVNSRDAVAIYQEGSDDPPKSPGGDQEVDGDQPIDKESLPHLKIHAPTMRTDKPHRMKGR